MLTQHSRVRSLKLSAIAALILLPLASAGADCPFDWSPGEGIPGVDGEINDAVVFNDGSGPALYVGGSFTVAGDAHAANIARWNGTKWSAVGGGITRAPNHWSWSPIVAALTIYNGELFAAGSFDTAGGSPANHFARWNGVSWAPLGSGLNTSAYAMTVFNNDLIIGAVPQYGEIGPPIARWNGATWSTLPGGGVSGTSFPGVASLTVFNGQLIVGGRFTSAGGVPAACIARFDGLNWSPFGTGVSNPNQDTPFVYASQVFNDELYIAGYFHTAGGVPVGHIARWTGSAWSDVGGGMDDDLAGLTIHAGQLVAVGGFSHAGGVPAHSVASWNGVQWSPIGNGSDAWTTTAVSFNGDLIIGGQFRHAGDRPARALARWDGADWKALAPGLNDRIQTTTTYAGDLVVAGDFQRIGDVHANRIAIKTGSGWAPLGAGFGQRVTCLGEFNHELIAGGWFELADGSPGNHIARWNGSSWNSLAGGMTGTLVSAITTYKGELIAGGSFVTAGGTPVQNIARWNGSAWSPFGAGLDNAVYGFATLGNDLIVCGAFHSAGGAAANSLARWDGANWHAFGAGPIGEFQYVQGLFVSGSDLFAGGSFSQIDGVSAHCVARWDGAAWHALGAGLWFNDADDTWVRDLQMINGRLIAAGNFDYSGATDLYQIAQFDGANWTPLGGELQDPSSFSGVQLSSLDVHDGNLIVGGEFVMAGDQVSVNLAQWSPTIDTPEITHQPAGQIVQQAQPATFQVAAIGGQPLAYQWRKNGTNLTDSPNLSGALSDTLTIASTTSADIGQYDCVISNDCGAATSNPARLTVLGHIPGPPLNQSAAPASND